MLVNATSHYRSISYSKWYPRGKDVKSKATEKRLRLHERRVNHYGYR
jgi:hypothetical protein